MLYRLTRIPVLLTVLVCAGVLLLYSIIISNEDLTSNGGKTAAVVESEESFVLLEEGTAEVLEEHTSAVASSSVRTEETVLELQELPKTQPEMTSVDVDSPRSELLVPETVPEDWLPTSPQDCLSPEARALFSHPGECRRLLRGFI